MHEIMYIVLLLMHLIYNKHEPYTYSYMISFIYLFTLVEEKELIFKMDVYDKF